VTEQEFLQEGIFFAMAGAHTTHPSADPRDPRNTGMGKRTSRRYCASLASDPFFIQQCVFESLRLRPSSPVAKRRALCPVTLGDGKLPANEGDAIVIDLRQANREEAGVRDPIRDRFDPHRAVVGQAFAHGISMGLGAHACLGRNLAIGVEPREDTTPADHQFGTVPLIVKALLEAGIHADPDDKAARRPRHYTHFLGTLSRPLRPGAGDHLN